MVLLYFDTSLCLDTFLFLYVIQFLLHFISVLSHFIRVSKDKKDCTSALCLKFSSFKYLRSTFHPIEHNSAPFSITLQQELQFSPVLYHSITRIAFPLVFSNKFLTSKISPEALLMFIFLPIVF